MKDSLALQKHFEWQGKIETKVKCPVSSQEELSLAYTPGVADACLAIKEDIDLGYKLTAKHNLVAVVTDGTAILGLGNIGPLAGMPVMEGKCALFKEFAGVDAVPICLNTTDTEEIIKTIKNIEPSFGGINLEDISAPRCFEVEKRLIDELNIPVFHDDQHGTAIVVGAAVINACRLLNKDIHSINAVINGVGAAGTSIGKFLLDLGVNDVVMVDKSGILVKGVEYENKAHIEIANITNKYNKSGLLKDALVGADLFVGVSVGNIVSQDMIKSMAKDPIVFAMANPVPEISYQDALSAGAKIVGTGSSKNPNQINNVLVFPGLFRGALDVRASKITNEMMIACAYAIANYIDKKDLSTTNILPKATDKNCHKCVAEAIKKSAIECGVNKI